MPGQNLGTPFLERIMRTGKKRNALLGSPQSGGMNLPSPTGVGSGQKPPPRKPPAAAAQGPPTAAPMGAGAAPGGAGGATVPPTPEQMPEMPMPSLEEEFPSATLYEGDSDAVLPATDLYERFYRRFGRLPSDTESYILHIRREYEGKMNRPPTAGELKMILQRSHESREDRVIV